MLLAHLTHPHISVKFSKDPCRLWQNTRWCETKVATPKLNWAPYHIICQCFYVYVLLEGGHSVKNKIQQKMTTLQSMYLIWSVSTCTLSSGYCLLFLPESKIRFPINKSTYAQGQKKDIMLNVLETQLAFSLCFYFSKEGMTVYWTLYMCRM